MSDGEMIGSFIISFRETFEALLILAIILAYLKRMHKGELIGPVLLGGVIAILFSIFIGFTSHFLVASIPEKELIEATGAFIAVPVLTSVLYWMARKGPRLREEIGITIEKEVRARRSAYLGMITLGFIVVSREGVETVLLYSLYS